MGVCSLCCRARGPSGLWTKRARSTRWRWTSSPSRSKRSFSRPWPRRTDMLWYKSWLETRWRFLIGLALLLCSAAATVFSYPQVMKLMPMVPTNVSGPMGERIREAAELARDYRGYVWSQWFRQNGRQWTTLFAIILGTAGLLTPSSGALFTLSLPVSRRRLLGIRAATGLSELLLLAFLPALVIPMLSPAIRENYNVGNALVHSACLFVV